MGGDVKSCYTISWQLKQRGHDVTIITTNYEFDDGYANAIETDGVEVLPFTCSVNIKSYIYTPTIKKWLNNNIKNYDVIHMHTFRCYQNNAVRHYANKYNIPYILQARGSVLPFFAKQFLKKLYDVVWGKRILEHATKIIALNKMEAEQYKTMGVDESKIEIIPNGIDVSYYGDLPERGSFREKYRIKDNEKVILFLGRIHKIKGVDLLVDAFSEVIRDIDDVKLVIVGPDHGYLSLVEERINDLELNDKVIMTGSLYGADKTAAYVDADIYVLPSRYEVFGNTILESYACGTPVIVTDRCGISDFVKNVGCVVNFDRNELRDAIIVLLKDNDLRERFGREGKELVKKQFDLNEIVACFEKVYSSCI